MWCGACSHPLSLIFASLLAGIVVLRRHAVSATYGMDAVLPDALVGEGRAVRVASEPAVAAIASGFVAGTIPVRKPLAASALSLVRLLAELAGEIRLPRLFECGAGLEIAQIDANGAHTGVDVAKVIDVTVAEPAVAGHPTDVPWTRLPLDAELGSVDLSELQHFCLDKQVRRLEGTAGTAADVEHGVHIEDDVAAAREAQKAGHLIVVGEARLVTRHHDAGDDGQARFATVSLARPVETHLLEHLQHLVAALAVVPNCMLLAAYKPVLEIRIKAVALDHELHRQIEQLLGQFTSDELPCREQSHEQIEFSALAQNSERELAVLGMKRLARAGNADCDDAHGLGFLEQSLVISPLHAARLGGASAGETVGAKQIAPRRQTHPNGLEPLTGQLEPCLDPHLRVNPKNKANEPKVGVYNLVQHRFPLLELVGAQSRHFLIAFTVDGGVSPLSS